MKSKAADYLRQGESLPYRCQKDCRRRSSHVAAREAYLAVFHAAEAIVARVTAINQAVLVFAPFAFGVLHDLSGSYAVAFSAAAVFQLAAGAIVLAGRQMLNPIHTHIVRGSDTNPREPR